MPQLSVGQQLYENLMWDYRVTMELRRTGILWNRSAAVRLDAEWSEKRDIALQEARKLAAQAGPEFAELNPGSPTQLRKLFFEKCGLAPIHYTEKGAVSTGYDALMAIRKQADNSFAARIAQHVLDYRDADKLLGTYIRGMAPPPGQNRCYGQWKAHTTVSGRWSCTGVPLQTLSATTRELFIAAPGNVFVECDLSSAEGRTIALLAPSDKLLNIFDTGGDVYCIIGSSMFGTKVVKGDKLRQLAKVSFLSFNYGAQADTAFNLFWADENIRKSFPNLTVRDVEALQNKYRKVLPEIFEWGKAEQKASQKRGYYYCPWNKRRIPFYGPAELSMAANQPNQIGVSAWMHNTMRKALPRLPDFQAELRTMVHDSITAECPEKVSQDVADMLVSAMEGTLTLNGRSVQMKAEYKIGRTLRDVK